jgi:hypothetical protein
MPWRLFLIWCIAILAFLALALSSRARDLGQWQYQDPSISEYFQSLMQPDSPAASCCGSGDSYWADLTDSGPNGETIAIITDSRPDAPLKRLHIEAGTRIVVPPNKIRRPARFNPTGHTLLFVGQAGTVYCYEPQPLF